MIGCELDASEAERLAGAPDDQLGFFLSKFATKWYGWLEDRAIGQRAIAGKPLYLSSGIDFIDDANSVMSVSAYKRAALCFTEIAVPDPLAAALHPAVEVGNLTGAFPIEKTQCAFRDGLLRLAEIAPLIRAGAFVLAPSAFCGLHPIVQSRAREELQNASPQELQFPARFDLDDFAIAVALAACTEAWPIATRPGVFERIEKGLSAAARKGKSLDFEVARAITSFDLPDASQVDAQLLAKVRMDNRRFAEFREKLDLAIVDGAKIAEDNPELFAIFLKDHLAAAAEECRKAAHFSPALDGVIAPTVAALSIAAAKFGVGEGVDLNNHAKLLAAVSEIALPGAAWFITQVARAFVSPEVRGKRRLARLYGSLTESLPGATSGDKDQRR
jgi:hypothetical protein